MRSSRVRGTDLVDAVRTVASGQSMPGPRAASQLMARLRRQSAGKDSLARPDRAGEEDPGADRRGPDQRALGMECRAQAAAYAARTFGDRPPGNRRSRDGGGARACRTPYPGRIPTPTGGYDLGGGTAVTEQATGRPRIVAGVDGSESSKAALAWAVRQAGLTGAVVEAVTAWQFPVYYGHVVASESADLGEQADSMLREAVANAAAQAPGVQIRPVVVQENAARALLDAARDAELLVVGSRGHAGLAEALLGSVSQHCAHHADCPVVIVRNCHTRLDGKTSSARPPVEGGAC